MTNAHRRTRSRIPVAGWYRPERDHPGVRISLLQQFAEFELTPVIIPAKIAPRIFPAIKGNDRVYLGDRANIFIALPEHLGVTPSGIHNAPLSFVLHCRSDISGQNRMWNKDPTKRSILLGWINVDIFLSEARSLYSSFWSLGVYVHWISKSCTITAARL